MIQLLHILIDKTDITFYADGLKIPVKFLVGQNVNITIVTEISDEKSAPTDADAAQTTTKEKL